MFVFKCAESKEHVEETNIHSSDIENITNFFDHYNIPYTLPDDFNQIITSADKHKLHDLAHYLLEQGLLSEDLLRKALKPFDYVVDNMKEKQRKCRDGLV